MGKWEDFMRSTIKKSSLIKEFKHQIKNKKTEELRKLDKSFFEIVNRVYRNKPLDLKFHITKSNTIAFNIEYPDDKNVYLEHFIDKSPNTLVSFSMSNDNFDTKDDLFHGDLEIALDKIDQNLIKGNVPN